MVGALLLYMAFLMLVDPLIRKPDAYTERLHNEEENEVAAPPPNAASLGPRRAVFPSPSAPVAPLPCGVLCVTRTAVSPQRGQP